jgi:hypothetical protein
LEFFVKSADRLVFRDLGAERKLYPNHVPLYSYRCAAVASDRGAASWSPLATSSQTSIDIDLGGSAIVEATRAASMEEYPFLAIELRVRRYEDWSRPVTAYLSRQSGRVVAVVR